MDYFDVYTASESASFSAEYPGNCEKSRKTMAAPRIVRKPLRFAQAAGHQEKPPNDGIKIRRL